MTAKHSDMVKVKTAIERQERSLERIELKLKEISDQLGTVYRLLTR